MPSLVTYPTKVHPGRSHYRCYVTKTQIEGLAGSQLYFVRYIGRPVLFVFAIPSSVHTIAMALLGLAPEIVHHISNDLDYASKVALRLSCWELYCKLEPPTNRYSMADLLEIEQWPAYNGAKSMPLECQQPGGHRDFFACHLCLKIRSADNFANAMMKSKRGKLGRGTISERSKRFCIQCGVGHGQYHRGTYIQFGGAAQSHGFVCWGCGLFTSIAHCTETQIAKRRCRVCWCRTHRDDTTSLSPTRDLNAITTYRRPHTNYC
jgi:hypothetical protein